MSIDSGISLRNEGGHIGVSCRRIIGSCNRYPDLACVRRALVIGDGNGNREDCRIAQVQMIVGTIRWIEGVGAIAVQGESVGRRRARTNTESYIRIDILIGSNQLTSKQRVIFMDEMFSRDFKYRRLVLIGDV